MFPSELPPVSNRLLYAYRVLAKWFSFFFFGTTTLILGILIFPVMRLFLHPKDRFKKYGRRFASSGIRFFVGLMHFIGIVDLEAGDRKFYRQLNSKIITANHPSLLDTIMLLSLIPNADFIVAAYHNNTILRGVVGQLYILSSLDFDDILKAASESLTQGNCLVIFPEGTRTPRYGKNIIKKGAVRISLDSGCPILPLHIGGTDKYGLGKKDPWTAFNPTDRYVYRISIGEELQPEKYQHLSRPAAVRAMTNDLSAVLFPAKNTCEKEA